MLQLAAVVSLTPSGTEPPSHLRGYRGPVVSSDHRLIERPFRAEREIATLDTHDVDDGDDVDVMMMMLLL